MCHEIRKYMGDVNGSGPLGGPGKHVEIDETFIGGFRSPKAVVMAMLERGGDVQTHVVPNQSMTGVRMSALSGTTYASMCETRLTSRTSSPTVGRRTLPIKMSISATCSI